MASLYNYGRKEGSSFQMVKARDLWWAPETWERGRGRGKAPGEEQIGFS
jgi:hypothetical protein